MGLDGIPFAEGARRALHGPLDRLEPLGRLFRDGHAANLLSKPPREVVGCLLGLLLALRLVSELLAFARRERIRNVGHCAARSVLEILSPGRGLARLRSGLSRPTVAAAKHHRRKLEVFGEGVRSLREPVRHRHRFSDVAAFERLLEIVETLAGALLQPRLVRPESLRVDPFEKT